MSDRKAIVMPPLGNSSYMPVGKISIACSGLSIYENSSVTITMLFGSHTCVGVYLSFGPNVKVGIAARRASGMISGVAVGVEVGVATTARAEAFSMVRRTTSSIGESMVAKETVEG
jgi:hypothetical protein